MPGAGFLLNNEMGDFNAGPGPDQRAGPDRHAAEPRAPGKRMLSSMAPTIVAKDGQLFMVTGIAGRPHDHQHRADDDPQRDRLRHERAGSRGRRPHPSPVAARPPELERYGFSADTIKTLRRWATPFAEGGGQGVAQVIVVNQKDACSKAASTGGRPTAGPPASKLMWRVLVVLALLWPSHLSAKFLDGIPPMILGQSVLRPPTVLPETIRRMKRQ